MARGTTGGRTNAEILESIGKRDITYVKDKDPNRYYRHARKDELRVEELEYEGFVVEGKAAPDSEGAIEGDGTGRKNMPGHVLMSRDRELHEAIIAKKKGKFDQMAEREQEQAAEQANKALKEMGVSAQVRRKLESVNRDI